MCKLVLLKFGEGDWNIGFPVNLRIRETGKSEIETDGRLSPAPELPRLYQDWKMVVYSDLKAGLRRGNFAGVTQNYRKLKKTDERTTNFSVQDSAKALECRLNDWLSGENEGFRPIREMLLRHLNETDEIRFVISARSPLLWQLPWHLCNLFASYPHADVTLGSLERPIESLVIHPKDSIKILVVLGGAEDIDVEADLHLLRDRLPWEAKLLEPLVATDFKTLTEALWQNEIDILFFAGHSTSQGQKGRFFLNETESVAIQELKYALQKAIARGLKLAIFNSCDGIQLARDLVDVQMPAVIVMREPIPDEAAQAFLRHFLEAFADKKMPLYQAVREARERLQGLEKKYPYLTWLPVLYQHPYAEDLRWDGMLQLSRAIEPPMAFKLPRFPYLAAAITASFLLVGGWLGTKHLSNYFNKRSSICLTQSKMKCVRKNLDWALLLNPKNADALNNMGWLHDILQEYDLAYGYFIEAKLQGNVTACNSAAYVQIRNAKINNIPVLYREAEDLLHICLKQADTAFLRYFIYKNIGWSLFEQDSYDEAEKHLRNAIAVPEMRSKGSANCLLAAILDSRKAKSDAIVEWSHCLNSSDSIREEREWKRLARKRIRELKDFKP
ncbi:MAG: CHAT domain-containing protein [Cyanobacteria bacterium P01_E01_bin.42]